MKKHKVAAVPYPLREDGSHLWCCDCKVNLDKNEDAFAEHLAEIQSYYKRAYLDKGYLLPQVAWKIMRMKTETKLVLVNPN